MAELSAMMKLVEARSKGAVCYIVRLKTQHVTVAAHSLCSWNLGEGWRKYRFVPPWWRGRSSGGMERILIRTALVMRT